jgi:hypothetical protein
MTLRIWHIAALVAWGAATYGVLQIRRLSGLLPGCSICGAWG